MSEFAEAVQLACIVHYRSSRTLLGVTLSLRVHGTVACHNLLFAIRSAVDSCDAQRPDAAQAARLRGNLLRQLPTQ
jgi:hypothetical protein